MHAAAIWAEQEKTMKARTAPVHFSLLRLSGLWRVSLAGGLIGLIWLGVFWALR